MATKTKRKPNPLGRRLPKDKWGRKDFWQKPHIEGKRRKRTKAALEQIEAVADEMVKWGYDVELRQVEDSIPTLLIRDQVPYRSTVTLRFRPHVPAVGMTQEWDPKVAVEAGGLWDDIFNIGEYAQRLRLMGMRLFEALKEVW